MQRRSFLMATGAGVTATTAGCLGLFPPSDDSHPLADRTTTVRIDAASDSPHDLHQNARESLEFWEEHSQEYVDFSVEFAIVSHDDPDMVIAYADTPAGCENVEEYSERVLGCAPLLRPGRRPPQPITARVVAARRPVGKIQITTKHEIGHILGLDHDADPRWIMSNRPEDRIPEYGVRIEIWETVQETHSQSNETTRLLNHGITLFSQGEYVAAAAAFEAANEDFGQFREQIDEAIDQTGVFDGHPRVETVALERLRELLDKLSSRMTVAEALTAALGRAATAAADGDDQRRNEELTTANDRIDEFNGIGQIQLREIAVALGLVRGFDNTEPVIDLDEDDLDEDDLDEPDAGDSMLASQQAKNG